MQFASTDLDEVITVDLTTGQVAPRLPDSEAPGARRKRLMKSVESQPAVRLVDDDSRPPSSQMAADRRTRGMMSVHNALRAQKKAVVSAVAAAGPATAY